MAAPSAQPNLGSLPQRPSQSSQARAPDNAHSAVPQMRGQYEDDEAEDGDGEVEDEDEDDYEQQEGTEEASEMLKEVTVKAGYLWKKGEKRKVSTGRVRSLFTH